MRPHLRACATIATGALALTLTATAAQAATTTLDLGKLPRGADVAIPHLEGKTVVDGSTRIPVQGGTVTLLGKSGTSYVVGTAKRDGSGGRILRVDSTGATTDLGSADPYSSHLSGDGQTVVSTRATGRGANLTTTAKARSVATGSLVAKKRFTGYLDVLDAHGTQIVLGGFESGTQLWDSATGKVTKVSGRVGYEADLSLDLLASFTKDPYSGGCTVVSSLSKPGTRLWTSCSDAVMEFSTDGSRLAVTDILSDGLGPAAVTVRTLAGKAVGTYVVKNGYFGEIVFEGPHAVLLDTNGPHKAAVVRCDRSACERASDLEAAVSPRAA